jgi:hypothetical protein
MPKSILEAGNNSKRPLSPEHDAMRKRLNADLNCDFRNNPPPPTVYGDKFLDWKLAEKKVKTQEEEIRKLGEQSSMLREENEGLKKELGLRNGEVKNLEEGRTLLQEQGQQKLKTIAELSYKAQQKPEEVAEVSDNPEVSNGTATSLQDTVKKLQSQTVLATHYYVDTLYKSLRHKEGVDAGEAWAKTMAEMESTLPADTVKLYMLWREKNEEDKWDKGGLPIV